MIDMTDTVMEVSLVRNHRTQRGDRFEEDQIYAGKTKGISQLSSVFIPLFFPLCLSHFLFSDVQTF